MSLKSWLRARQHVPGVRAGLDLVQWAYSGLTDREGPPAIAGGRPLRCLPLPPPQPITGPERRQLKRVARGQSTSFFDGTLVHELEQGLAEKWNANHVLATSSGTAALHTALMAAEIGPGDEVIVPVLTYVATAMAVLHAGAKPVFVDIQEDTWNIDPGEVHRAITPATRAVIPVHIGGVPCDMDSLRAIASEHDLLIIEDAAHAHGSTYKGQFCGTLGDIGCFSFGSPKSMTTGEGGAVFLRHPEHAQRARMAMNLGECTPEGQPSMELDVFSPETRLDYRMVGWNYRMSVAQAALGLGQLERFDAIRQRRQENGKILREGLSQLSGAVPQRVPEGCDPCYYCFPVFLDPQLPISRGELLQGLAAERIDFRLLSNLPLCEHEIFRSPGSFPVAQGISRQAVALRVDPALGRREMTDTLDAIRRLLRWAQTRTDSTPALQVP